MYFHAGERETDVTDVAVTVASQTDEDVTLREMLFHVSLGEMIHHFLAQAIDIQRSKLIDKLVVKDILSSADKQKIKEAKNTDAKVNSLLIIMSQKSAAQFESFLTTLSETGQQSVADVVHEALHTVRQTGHNPLQYAQGMPA